eukprot:CAMPEP_0197446262 /NCGR_PEP_ID=MMETSP1175-20131217/11251_1 /TAXON_ID=1003142 /ORGANISM="Triceratium dubium, Strain CCMP147" /LENGTH=126 /DNA_ID=CAMNT_0042977345 /DNA_START=275 /DNA_END=652 /DNA_ORIENTATION=-
MTSDKNNINGVSNNIKKHETNVVPMSPSNTSVHNVPCAVIQASVEFSNRHASLGMPSSNIHEYPGEIVSDDDSCLDSSDSANFAGLCNWGSATYRAKRDADASSPGHTVCRTQVEKEDLTKDMLLL